MTKKIEYSETPRVGDIVRTTFGPPWRTYIVDEVEIRPQGIRFRGRQTTWQGIPYKKARSVWLAFKRPGTIAGTEVRYKIIEHSQKKTKKDNPGKGKKSMLKKKYGKIGAPGSAKRKKWMAHIRKKL